MPLDHAFTHHLHQLMVEVSEAVAESEAKYKAELVWKAQQTHNAGAMPVAYRDAALHALQTRFDRTVERYLHALLEWGIPIDDNVEREVRTHINLLTSGPNSLRFPPGLRVMNTDAVQQSYAQERQRLAHQLQRSAGNRLRELKMKSIRQHQVAQQTIQPVVTNVHFNAPVGNAYIDSVHNSTTNVEIDMQTLRDIDSLSAAHPALHDAAKEIRAAYPQKTSMFEKARNWVALLASVDGLTEKAIQLYPKIAGLIHHLSQS
jgi:hypothetical protein